MRDSQSGLAIKQASSQPAVTSRALILGAILIRFNVYWVMMVEGIWHTGHPTVMALPWGVVFNIILLLLARLNAIPGVSIPESAIDKRPSIPLAALINEHPLYQVLSVLDWCVEQILGSYSPTDRSINQ